MDPPFAIATRPKQGVVQALAVEGDPSAHARNLLRFWLHLLLLVYPMLGVTPRLLLLRPSSKPLLTCCTFCGLRRHPPPLSAVVIAVILWLFFGQCEHKLLYKIKKIFLPE